MWSLEIPEVDGTTCRNYVKKIRQSLLPTLITYFPSPCLVNINHLMLSSYRKSLKYGLPQETSK